jgi:CxxC-x17-CxxC domain-containing protein
MAFNDRELACRDCGSTFVFSSGEQEFYATKGLQHDPVRCPSCRQQRKTLRPEDREEVPRFGVYSSWGGRTPRQLHVAACAQCGKMTEVPFVPRGDRPVYCSDCYNDIRRKQEAQQEAEEEAALARMSAASGRSADPLESDAAEAVPAAAEAEPEPARPVVHDPEAGRV